MTDTAKGMLMIALAVVVVLLGLHLWAEWSADREVIACYEAAARVGVRASAAFCSVR